MTPTCTDSAPPGLATLQVAGPDEPRQSPTRLVSGYSLRLSVLPNTAIPRIPPRGPRSFSIAVFLSVSATQRRTGSLDPACLATGIQLIAVREVRCPLVRRTDCSDTIYAIRVRSVRLRIKMSLESGFPKGCSKASGASIYGLPGNFEFACDLGRAVLREKSSHVAIERSELIQHSSYVYTKFDVH